MPAEYEAPALQPVKIVDFAKLGRPYDQDSRIQPGDLLEVACSDLLRESKTGTLQVRVDPAGFATLPLLPSPLRLESLTCGDAEQAMSTAYRAANLIRRPNPSIKILEFNKKKIYVVGGVKNPGMYELRPDECNPLRAILAAGGLTEDAGAVVEVRRTSNVAQPNQPGPAQPRPIASRTNKQSDRDQWAMDRQQWAIFCPSGDGVLRPAAGGASDWAMEGDGDGNGTRPPTAVASRHKEVVIRFDLASKTFIARPDQLVLTNGDVISVEETKKQSLYVTGSVKKPGEFPMPKDREIHLLEAIGMAGGVNTLSEPTTALLTRRLANREPVVLSVDLRSAAGNPKENIRLMAGDAISVEEDWASQTRRFFREFIKLGLNGALPGLN